MKLKYFQKGFNYSQDGRGNRLIYHLQGCNLSCPWCANPEGMRLDGVLMADPEWLVPACCPKGAVTGGPEKYVLDREMCGSCTDLPCIYGMRTKGIRLSCREEETADILEECISSAPMFFDGGGVTLTGGEVSMQYEAVCELLEALGKNGIHRCIETNGTHPHADRLMELVDEWIMDFKHYDTGKHRAWLGTGNERVRETLERAAACHPDVLIRIPLMPGFNDSMADADEFAAYLGRYAARENVRAEVLTYHEFGKAKWAQCGMDYRMHGNLEPAARTCLEQKLKEQGIQVVRT